MKEKETGKQTAEPSSIIEDLTLDEAKAENIKGGPYDAFLKLDGIPGEAHAPATYDLKMAKK